MCTSTSLFFLLSHWKDMQLYYDILDAAFPHGYFSYTVNKQIILGNYVWIKKTRIFILLFRILLSSQLLEVS